MMNIGYDLETLGMSKGKALATLGRMVAISVAGTAGGAILGNAVSLNVGAEPMSIGNCAAIGTGAILGNCGADVINMAILKHAVSKTVTDSINDAFKNAAL